ncbi:CcdC family protein [Cohnella caldifontis]|uniref:CcdC family protein n=1 Tax=Cohnella caldifontis TaxID=3027471 RepID=UPI0023EC9D26|nr:cytochrome c biogenesis protein CcdC [Cohnella sp. YIM B05605]
MSTHLLAPSVMRVLSTVGTAGMASLVIAIRLKAAKRPTSLRKLIIPPLGMSTGFLMFLFPFMRVPFEYAIAALLVGLLLSYPLIHTSKFQVVDGQVYLKRSSSFIYVLLGLLLFRLLLHPLVEQYVTLPQSGALFFLLAFGMILLWRIVTALRYLNLTRESEPASAKESAAE